MSPTKTEFMLHLSAHHPEMEFQAVADRCERAVQSAQPCPICNVEYSPRQLESHLGRHLQQLATFALPKEADETDDEEADMEDGESATASALGSFDSNPDQPKAVKPDLPSVSNEMCLSIFEKFIDSEKPGLRRIYPDSDSPPAKATEGELIIEQLIEDGWSVNTARELVIITLYDIIIFNGLTRL